MGIAAGQTRKMWIKRRGNEQIRRVTGALSWCTCVAMVQRSNVVDFVGTKTVLATPVLGELWRVTARPLVSASAITFIILRMSSHMLGILAPDGPVVSAIRTQLPDTLAIYAFGSQIHGTAGQDSDLDLAVLVAGYADPLVLWSLSSALADKANCPVDLLDLRAATTVMQYQVITGGCRLWSTGLAVDLFECYVLSAKTDLDTARAPLLADILATGKVHG